MDVGWIPEVPGKDFYLSLIRNFQLQNIGKK
ncbi:uncharacterized protein METZ01_LOCUS11954 [marine metagenome]|uniref:Uncharacterized protein n=1 Tax=marine metagenome TaxID=408172 RepID=A0A381NX06_9ZZZZ